MKRDWSVAQREKRSIAVFSIDIDALDLYNATFGRAAGDSTIRRVAHVVSGCLRRSSDVAARIDGGSLMAFAPGLTTEQALRIGQLMAERVQGTQDPPSTLGGVALHQRERRCVRRGSGGGGQSRELAAEVAAAIADRQKGRTQSGRLIRSEIAAA